MISDEEGMRLAIAESYRCLSTEYYSVGAIIVSPSGEVLTTGYTNELRDDIGASCHAEEVALLKLTSRFGAQLPNELTLYSTMEPCSKRGSGKISCAERIAASPITRVVFGCREPYLDALKIVCEGEAVLKRHGIHTVHLVALQVEAEVCSYRFLGS